MDLVSELNTNLDNAETEIEYHQQKNSDLKAQNYKLV